MGIGLADGKVNMNRLPGWEPHSYGYHGDDGNSFCSSGNGQPYGPTFTTGDVIGNTSLFGLYQHRAVIHTCPHKYIVRDEMLYCGSGMISDFIKCYYTNAFDGGKYCYWLPLCLARLLR